MMCRKMGQLLRATSRCQLQQHYVAALHVGAALLHPLLVQPSDAALMITYPSLHANVAVETCVFPLLRMGALSFSGALSDEHDAVGAALGTEVVIGAEVIGAEVPAGAEVTGAEVGGGGVRVGHGEPLARSSRSSKRTRTTRRPRGLAARLLVNLNEVMPVAIAARQRS